MGVLREEEFDGFLKRRLSASNGLLIHGADASGVAQLARQVMRQLNGDVQHVDVAACKAAPGMFMDQFLSLSLLGERQVLLVDPADESCLKFLESALAYERPANFILVQADRLTKTSKLRAACEASKLCTALEIFEEDEGRLRTRLSKLLAVDQLAWGEDAEEAFFASVGTDRTIATREAEKLALFAHGSGAVTVADVQAICGDTAEYDADQLIDAILSGDLEETDRMVTSLGGETRSFFTLLQMHVARLQGLRIEMERGMNADSAIRNAKPPIFFKRKPAMMNQLRQLSLADMIEIQDALHAAILQSRKFAGLSETINARALLSLARFCRAKS